MIARSDSGAARLVEAEVYGDQDSCVDGLAVFRGGFETVELDCFKRLFVEAHAERLDDARVLRVAVCIDNEGDHADALKLLAAGLVRELRLGSDKRNGVGDAANTGCVSPIPCAAIRAGPIARTFARSVASSGTAADTAERTGAGGGQADVRRGVDADIEKRWIFGAVSYTHLRSRA